MKTYKLLPLVLLSACASLTTGQSQSLTVNSTPPGALCTLVNDKGTWYTTTPGSVVVQRAYGDMYIVCAKGKLTGKTTVKSHTKPMVAGNILFGGIIGGAVDAGTGAAYDYPNPIELPLK